jgi:hypothetical protein
LAIVQQTSIENVLEDLTTLFDEAKQRSEFNFVLTLLNFTGMALKELSSNLHGWFDAIEFYKGIFRLLSEKERTRIGTL